MWQLVVLSVVTLVKIGLWIFVPLLADEAYFIEWGQRFDFGYYDHTPMVGWIVALMKPIANHYLWYRFFSFFTHLVVAHILYRLSRPYGRQKAIYISLIFWVSAGSVLHFSILNDTALLLFVSLSYYFFYCFV